MKLSRSLQVALCSAVLFTSVSAQTEADVAALLAKAQRGNSIAQYRLGLAYSHGQGIAADPVEAYVWLSLAYEGGFRGKALALVAGGLEPAQFETARQKLAERRALLSGKPLSAASPKSPAIESDANIPVVRTTPAPSPAPAAASPAAETPAPASKLADELATAVADKQQLSGELSKSWAETEDLKKQLTETQATAEFLTAETSKIRGERDALSTKLDELTKEVVALRNDRDGNRALGAKAETAVKEASAQKAALESSLRAATENAAADKKWLGDELAKSSQEVSALKNQLAEATRKAAAAPAYPDLSGKVQELEASLARLSTESNNARQEADSLRKAAPAYPDLREQVAALHSQIADFNAQASESHQQIAALTQAKSAAEKSLAEKPAAPSYPDLSGKVRQLEASLATASADATAARQEASRLADERIDREKQLITLQQQSAELSAAQLGQQKEMQSLRQAVANPVVPPPAYPDLREQVATLNSQLATQAAQAKEASQQIAALAEARDTAEKAAAAKSAAPAYPDLSGKVKELDASLASLANELGAAKQEASRLADERIEREKHLITLQDQSSTLANALAALQQEAGKLREASHLPAVPAAPAYPDLREANAALNAQLATLKADAMQASQQIAALQLAKSATENMPAPPPAYPDLSGRVKELEASLASQTEATEKLRASLAAQPAASSQTSQPAYPDLSVKVQELEATLASRSNDATTASQNLAELRAAKTATDEKLAAAEQSRTELAQQFDEFKRSALANQRASLNQKSQVQILESEKAALRKQSDADQTRLAELSSQLAAARRQLTEVYPTTPAYPDQRARVEQLEAELSKTNEQAHGMVTLLNQSQQDAKAAAEQAEQLRTTIRELETKNSSALAAQPAAAPSYPDLSGKVRELEASLANLSAESNNAKQEADALRKTAAAAPAYPDLREQVSNLEIQLEAAKSLHKFVVSESQFNAMKQELADTKTKLSTTLQGYATIEKERDALATKSTQAANTSAEVARLTEANNTLQRSNAQIEGELATARSQLQQALTVNNSLAQQNSTPPSAPTPAPAPEPVAVRPVAKPAAPAVATAPLSKPTPMVVAAAPAPAPAPRIHTVAAGDSLTKISQRYYGTPNNWQPIYNANKEKLGPNGALKVGTELRIP